MPLNVSDHAMRFSRTIERTLSGSRCLCLPVAYFKLTRESPLFNVHTAAMGRELPLDCRPETASRPCTVIIDDFFGHQLFTGSGRRGRRHSEPLCGKRLQSAIAYQRAITGHRHVDTYGYACPHRAVSANPASR